MGAQLDEEFRDFMQHRWPAMVRLAHALTGDQGHAEDVAQAAFARAFASWPKIRRTGNPEAYVRRIVINENRNRFRKQRVPTLRHADAEHPVASYSATVRPPGPHSPPGLIASGTVKGQRWQIVAGRPGAGGAGRGQQIFLATGPALDSGSASTSVSTTDLKSTDPVLFLGLLCGPTQVQFGGLRADVSFVKVRLGTGSTLTLHPATVWGVRMVAFAIPIGAPVVSATAYSGRGEIATAIPFNAADGMAFFGTWLRPGQHGLARASGRIGSGSYLGRAWSATAYLGPWGVCLVGQAGTGTSSCMHAISAAGLGIKFFAFPFGKGPKPWKWTAYDGSGHVIASDKVPPAA